MNYHHAKSFVALGILFALGVPASMQAAELSYPLMPSGTVNCFDYYRFGSVTADFVTAMPSVVSGTNITFTGAIQNSNAYPIVDAKIFVKVLRMRGKEKDVNGPDVVDQFVVRDHITLAGGEKLPLTFAWKVPAFAKTGEYKLATYIVSQEAFNMSGLSFTDDVIGSATSFTVHGEVDSGVQFDKAGVSIQSAPYHFAAFAPEVSATSTVEVSAVIQNDTSQSVTVPVVWQVYEWDAMRQKNSIANKKQMVTLPAHTRMPVSLLVTDTRYPVYLVVGSLEWQDAKSFINVRFVRQGHDMARINFPGVNKFPLVAGSSTSVFSCLHNKGGSGSVENGKLILSVIDNTGQEIHSYTYAGTITSAMMGVKSDFVPPKNIASFTVQARLYQNDKMVDDAVVAYNCTDIEPSLCDTSEIHTSTKAQETSLFVKLLTLAGASALALALYAYERRRLVQAASPDVL